MGLEHAIVELQGRLRKLRDAVGEARLTIVEDQPPGEFAAVDPFSFGVDDIAGCTDEAFRQAAEAKKAAGQHPPDLNRASRALYQCQEHINRCGSRLIFGLVAHERIEELLGFARKRGRAWLGWATSAKEGLERCRQPWCDAGDAFLPCWQEIAERAGVASVSVQNTSIGAQISVPDRAEAASEAVP